MTAARTNNGSKMKTNKEFESTITTSSSVLTPYDKPFGTQQNGTEAATPRAV